MRIVERTFAEADRRALLDAGVHPVLAKVYAGRKIKSAAELKYEPAGLLAPSLMKGMPDAAALRSGRIGMLTTHVPEAGASFEILRGDLRRFWRRPRPLSAYQGVGA